MTFHEQPTTPFVPLECRYVAAALQLQPDARAAELTRDRESEQDMRDGETWGEAAGH